MEPLDDLVACLGRWSAGRGPLYVLLAGRLRQLIDDGELPAGSRLPPDRALAVALSVGRTTVIAAYDLLRDEGRIERRQGSGTRVAGAAATTDLPTGTHDPIFLHLMDPPDGVFLLSCAAPETAPPELTEAYRRAIERVAAVRHDLGYHPAGHRVLRQALADRFSGRGALTGHAQMLVTTGAQQALSLLARALIRPGDRVLVEAPTYPGALEAFREAGAVLRGVPVGPDGVDIEAMTRALRDERPALAYVVPTYHNPTGAVLPPMVRRRLAETAAAAGVPLVVDETLADLGFAGEAPPPPFGDSAITVGSLSKVAWGGVRVGWVRAPAGLVMRLARLKAVHDLGSDMVSQLAAAELLHRIDDVRHRRVTELRVRHDHLRAEFRRLLPGWDAPPVRGGQTLWIRLPHGDGTSFAQAALRRRVAVLPGGPLDVTGRSDAYLRVPFLAAPADLTDAVRRLADAWHDYDGVPGGVLPAFAV